MKKIKTRILILLIVGLIIGCDYTEPRSVFTVTIKKRTINLSNHIGESFSILRNQDTIEYRIFFDKKTDNNYILKYGIDTIFGGTVSKHGGMFLLYRKLENSNYRISALKFTDSTVIGLEQELTQSYLIDAEIQNGNFSSTIIDTNDQYILELNKKTGKDLFKAILQKLEPEKLIVDHEIVEIINMLDTIEEAETKNLKKKFNVILKVYPNPVDGILNVETSNSIKNYEYQLLDITGKIFRKGIFYENGGRINCSSLRPGEYFLVIKETKEVVKIIKN